MTWLVRFLSSSIGRKQMMAMTGLAFCAFLSVHLFGNFFIYAGRGAFNAYAHALHSLGPVVTGMELGLIFFATVHVGTGTWLFIGNWLARPRGYAVRRSAGGKTWSSSLMPYTGLFMAGFVSLHLFHFTLADQSTATVADLVSGRLGRPGWAVFYLAAMVVVGLHVRHGFWSAFQTVGANHPKYMPAIRILAVLFAVVLAAGFGSLPLFIYFRGMGS